MLKTHCLSSAVILLPGEAFCLSDPDTHIWRQFFSCFSCSQKRVGHDVEKGQSMARHSALFLAAQLLVLYGRAVAGDGLTLTVIPTLTQERLPARRPRGPLER